jgi:hypothetical protein
MDENDLLPMRFTLVRAGIGARPSGVVWCKPTLQESVLLSLREAPDGNRNRDPRRDRYESTQQKNLCSNRFRGLLAAEGRFRIHLINSATALQSGSHI